MILRAANQILIVEGVISQGPSIFRGQAISTPGQGRVGKATGAGEGTQEPTQVRT